jgi:hypothetical protein
MLRLASMVVFTSFQVSVVPCTNPMYVCADHVDADHRIYLATLNVYLVPQPGSTVNEESEASRFATTVLLPEPVDVPSAQVIVYEDDSEDDDEDDDGDDDLVHVWLLL